MKKEICPKCNNKMEFEFDNNRSEEFQKGFTPPKEYDRVDEMIFKCTKCNFMKKILC